MGVLNRRFPGHRSKLAWSRSGIFLIIYALFFCLSYLIIDPDFGWHLKSGEYIAQHGIPQTDIFTYTAADFPWINHEWLNDFIVFTAYDRGGYLSLAILFATLWTASFVLLPVRLRHNFLFLAATLAILPYVGVRPLVWAVLFLVVLLRILELPPGFKQVGLLPSLFFFWANLHGSFTLGLVVLLIWLTRLPLINSLKKLPHLPPILLTRLKQAEEPAPYGYFPIFFIILFTFLATLLNPYGYRIYIEIFRTASDPTLSLYITEWQPFYLPPLTFAYYLFFIFVYLISKHGRAWPFTSWSGFFFSLSLASSRHAPFFILTSLAALDWYWDRLSSPLQSGHLQRHRKLFLSGFLVAFLLLTGYVVAVSIRSIRSDLDKYPAAISDYLRDHPCSGNLFNDYSLGGYLIWQNPGHPVYIDGRMPSWQDNGATYAENYARLLQDEDYRQKQFAAYNITCAVIQESSPLSARLLQENWQITLVDGKYAYLLKP